VWDSGNQVVISDYVAADTTGYHYIVKNEELNELDRTDTYKFIQNNAQIIQPLTMTVVKIDDGTRFQNLRFEGYDPDSHYAEHTYGKIGNHTTRCDQHWEQLSTQYITSPSTQLIFNVLDPIKGDIFNDLFKHELVSKYPIVQFRMTSIPTANLLLRITQLNRSQVDPENPDPLPIDDILQLPGTEFSLKDQELKLQPYWNRKAPGDYIDNYEECYYQVDVLGGHLPTEPVAIAAYINPTPLEYFHLNNRIDSEIGRRLDKSSSLRYEISETPDEPADSETVEEDVQVNTNTEIEVKSGETIAPAIAERRYQYVTTLEVPPSRSAVELKLSPASLGKYFAKHLSQYNFWRGTPRFKIAFSNNMLINSNVHVVHRPEYGTLSSDTFFDPTTLLHNSGFATTSATSNAIDIDIKWRRAEEWLHTSSSETETNNLGSLALIFPNISSNITTNFDQNLVVTIHVDTSDISMAVPIYNEIDSALSVKSYDRTGAIVV